MAKTLSPKHTVHINEDFEIRTTLGALVVTTPRTGETTTIDAPREHVTTYKTGERCRFNNKPDALAFAKHHGGKVSYLGKV
jgi:hypothetical protein